MKALAPEIVEHWNRLDSEEPYTAVQVDDLLAIEFPPRDDLFGGWLCSQSLNMVHAWRGVGKTHAALNIAYAVASGGSWLQWKSPEPARVLYLDGEMPGVAIQQRLSEIIANSEHEARPDHLRVLTPDLNRHRAMPDLVTSTGQRDIDEMASDAKLIIVDNLSCLARSGGNENEAESWLPVADWALRQRVAGRAVLFVHHSGKGGLQRGTSKREDILDSVISLRHPRDYEPSDGARFEIHFEKARGLHGDAVAAVEAKLTTDENGRQLWASRPLTEGQNERIQELKDDGLTIREIAEELGLSKSTVARRLKS